MTAVTSKMTATEKPKLAPDLELGGPVYRALFQKRTSIASAIALGLSVVLPNHGDLGIQLCWFKRWTDLPCPGCGLTRCFTCISHGHLSQAVHFNLMGPIVYLIAVASALTLVIGEKRRMKLAAFFSSNPRVAHYVYWGFISSFITFGLVRLLVLWLFPSLSTQSSLFANV